MRLVLRVLLDTGTRPWYTTYMTKFSYIPRRVYELSPSGCWEWKGRLNKHGRPAASLFGVTIFRFLCHVAHGPPPHENWHAAHICDNRVCINPDHAEWQPPEQNNTPPNPTTEWEEHRGVVFRIKPRKSSKGGGRSINGFCAVFRVSGKQYKSGAYHHREGAVRWAQNKIENLVSDT